MASGSGQGSGGQHGSKGKPEAPRRGEVANQPGTKPQGGAVDKANERDSGSKSEGSKGVGEAGTTTGSNRGG